MENKKIYKYNFDNLGGEIINQWGTYKRNKRNIRESIEYNGNIYKQIENIDGFYNKAIIYQDIKNSNNYFLLSYETIVAEYNGKYFNIFGYYSATTARHLNYFFEKFGFKKLSKKEIETTKEYHFC